MSRLSFGVEIGAVDRSQPALRSALSGFEGLAGGVKRALSGAFNIGAGAMGFMRDFNLGLRPIIADIDRAITKAVESGPAKKALESLTGRTPHQADLLAKRIQDAAGGSLTLDRTIELTNKAIATGVDAAKELPIIFDFASRKAAATGQSFEGMIEGILSGAARGTTRAFEPLGILQGGVESVKKDFESLKAAGSWDALKPAAQDAEILRHAVREMQEQMGKMGITGRETAFTWARIKTGIADSVDEMWEAIGNSNTLKDTLETVRDSIDSIKRHFKEGGSLWEMLTGKEKGKSEGLLGGLKAGLMDFSELVGRGILGGLLKGISVLPDVFSGAWEGLKSAWMWAMDEVPPAIIKGLQWLEGTFIPALTAWRAETIDALAIWIKGYLVNPDGTPTLAGRAVGINQQEGKGLWDSTADMSRMPGDASDAIKQGVPEFWRNLKEELHDFWHWTTLGQMVEPQPRSRSSAAGRGGTGLGWGWGWGVDSDPGFFGTVGRAADDILGGGIFGKENSRTRDWYGNWQKDFPPRLRRSFRPAPEPIIQDSDFRLNLHERQKRATELRRVQREMFKIEHGDIAAARQAWKDTYAEERRLRRAGRTLVKGDRRKIYIAARHRVQLQQDDGLAKLRAQKKALQDELRQGRRVSARAAVPARESGGSVQPPIVGKRTAGSIADREAGVSWKDFGQAGILAAWASRLNPGASDRGGAKDFAEGGKALKDSSTKLETFGTQLKTSLDKVAGLLTQVCQVLGATEAEINRTR